MWINKEDINLLGNRLAELDTEVGKLRERVKNQDKEIATLKSDGRTTFYRIRSQSEIDSIFNNSLASLASFGIGYKRPPAPPKQNDRHITNKEVINMILDHIGLELKATQEKESEILLQKKPKTKAKPKT